jgi:heme-degrading monooxygenase HmoA
MYARVETFHAEPEEMNDLVSAQHHTVGLVRTLPGNMGGYVLVNRDAGRVLSVTFWQTEEELEAAETEFEASPKRGHISDYAVAMQEALGPV